ncbi:MAG: type II and III secretion system protein [Bdellovibrionaceae bacterium]|nr:type II and III secretion system protein [Pseudobdellovibrionaceae bacterium]
MPTVLFSILSAGLALVSVPSYGGDSPSGLPDHVIGVGTSVVLPALGAGPITVSDGRVLKAEDLGNRVRLTGRKPGLAAVSTARNTHFISVLSAGAFHVYRQLERLTAEMQGLSVHVESGIVIVEGKLLRVSDWKRLASEVSSGGYTFRAEPDVLIRQDAELSIAQIVRDAGLPPLDLQLVPATVRLAADRADLKARVNAVLGPYGFTIEKSEGALTLEPLVRVQILVTEIRKSMLRRLGVSWPSSATAQALPSFQAPGRSPLAVEIQALEQSGAGRILASPNLLCRSGKEAQFLAGGEFPIKVSGNKRQDVVWKRYGVMLKIKPQADFSGRMSIALETEVSTFDPHRSVDGLPGMLTNRIETHFDLVRAQTIALSGLIKHESGSSSAGLPGLSSLPILGYLFSSKEFQDHKTELVVFVTPEVMPADGATL